MNAVLFHRKVKVQDGGLYPELKLNRYISEIVSYIGTDIERLLNAHQVPQY